MSPPPHHAGAPSTRAGGVSVVSRSRKRSCRSCALSGGGVRTSTLLQRSTFPISNASSFKASDEKSGLAVRLETCRQGAAAAQRRATSRQQQGLTSSGERRGSVPVQSLQRSAGMQLLSTASPAPGRAICDGWALWHNVLTHNRSRLGCTGGPQAAVTCTACDHWPRMHTRWRSPAAARTNACHADVPPQPASRSPAGACVPCLPS